jgi:hypothetical protein
MTISSSAADRLLFASLPLLPYLVEPSFAQMLLPPPRIKVIFSEAVETVVAQALRLVDQRTTLLSKDVMYVPDDSIRMPDVALAPVERFVKLLARSLHNKTLRLSHNGMRKLLNHAIAVCLRQIAGTIEHEDTNEKRQAYIKLKEEAKIARKQKREERKQEEKTTTLHTHTNEQIEPPSIIPLPETTSLPHLTVDDDADIGSSLPF